MGFNWANWKNPEFDALVDQIEKSTDPEEIASDIRRGHEVIVDDAAWLFIVHDLNPRAMPLTQLRVGLGSALPRRKSCGRLRFERQYRD